MTTTAEPIPAPGTVVIRPGAERPSFFESGQAPARLTEGEAARHRRVLEEFDREYAHAWGTEAGKFWLDRYSPGLAPYANLMAARNRRVVDLCRPGRALLDVGSGYGDLLYLLRDRYRVLRGIEPSDTAVRLATHNLSIRRVTADFEFRQGLAEHLPYDDGAFSTVLMLDVYEHIEPGFRARALSEALRVLEPGGQLIIATPSRARLRFWNVADNLLTLPRQVRQRRRSGRPVAIWKYPPRPCCEVFCSSRELRRDVAAAGARVVHFERVSFYPAPERGGLLGPYLEPKRADHPLVRRTMRFVEFMERLGFLNQKMIVVAEKPRLGPACA